MTYAQGSKILAADYNTLAALVNSQWAAGTGRHGYGQTPITPTVASGDGNQVKADEWNKLIATINRCLAHQGQAQVTPATVQINDLIRYYQSLLDGANNSYFGSGRTAYGLAPVTSLATTWASTWGNWINGDRALTFTQTATFANADAARYFFNAGGTIALTFAHGNTSTARNVSWTNFANACGAINIGHINTAKVGGSGAVTTLLNGNNGGYWSGSTAYATHFLQVDSGSAAGNTIRVEYFWSGAILNSGCPTLNIRTTWLNSNAGADAVNGPSTTTITALATSNSQLTLNSWGTPVLAGSLTHDVGGIQYSPFAWSSTSTAPFSVTIPPYVTYVNIGIGSGGGGAGGQDDSHPGLNAYPGMAINGRLAVSPGQTLAVYIGAGGTGGGGDINAGSSYGGNGGANAAGYTGGNGGSGGGGAGGGGGGGGAATVVTLNGTPVIVAGGGAGGGGNGTRTRVTTRASGYAGGGAGVSGVSSSSGGGGGGGGGGYPNGGAGGQSPGGDYTGYSGNDGKSLVPAGFTISALANSGTGLVGIGKNGTGGYANISW